MTARIEHLAVDDANAAAPGDMDQAAIFRQRFILAFEDEAGERHVVGAVRGNQRRSAFEDQARRAAHAHDLGPGRQLELAGAIFARAEHERHPCACGLIDGVLQRRSLFHRAARAHAELHRIHAQHRHRRCARRRRQRHGGHRGGQRGKPEKSAAVEAHGPAPVLSSRNGSSLGPKNLCRIGTTMSDHGTVNASVVPRREFRA